MTTLRDQHFIMDHAQYDPSIPLADWLDNPFTDDSPEPNQLADMIRQNRIPNMREDH